MRQFLTSLALMALTAEARRTRVNRRDGEGTTLEKKYTVDEADADVLDNASENGVYIEKELKEDEQITMKVDRKNVVKDPSTVAEKLPNLKFVAPNETEYQAEFLGWAATYS